eukprot:scaffold535_cov260-Pinguiococcus_pyrenoidosus.AAC.23
MLQLLTIAEVPHSRDAVLGSREQPPRRGVKCHAREFAASAAELEHEVAVLDVPDANFVAICTDYLAEVHVVDRRNDGAVMRLLRRFCAVVLRHKRPHAHGHACGNEPTARLGVPAVRLAMLATLEQGPFIPNSSCEEELLARAVNDGLLDPVVEGVPHFDCAIHADTDVALVNVVDVHGQDSGRVASNASNKLAGVRVPHKDEAVQATAHDGAVLRVPLRMTHSPAVALECPCGNRLAHVEDANGAVEAAAE